MVGGTSLGCIIEGSVKVVKAPPNVLPDAFAMKVAFLLLLITAPGAAQTADLAERLKDPVAQEGVAAIMAWTALARAAHPDSWVKTSPRFQERIAAWRWHRWAGEHIPQWEGVGPAQVESLELVYTDAPDPPGAWVGVILAHDRARGGKMYERVWAVRENGAPWGVVDYALWADGAAIVTNAYVRPIVWLSEAYGDRIEGFWFLRNPR